MLPDSRVHFSALTEAERQLPLYEDFSEAERGDEAPPVVVRHRPATEEVHDDRDFLKLWEDEGCPLVYRPGFHLSLRPGRGLVCLVTFDILLICLFRHSVSHILDVLIRTTAR